MMAERLTSEQRSANMARVRGKNTTPELQVRSLLHRMGYRFRLHSKELPGKPDIILPKHRKIIFVHGCFWHRHPNCKRSTTPATNTEFWQRKFNSNVTRDKEVKKLLEQAGWKVYAIWECETKKDEDLSSLLIKIMNE